jgi:hypothetical protein
MSDDRAAWLAGCGTAADGLTVALENYQRVQDEFVEARNRLARAIAGAAMSGMTRDEIVELTGLPDDLVLRICRDAGISESSSVQATGDLRSADELGDKLNTEGA